MIAEQVMLKEFRFPSGEKTKEEVSPPRFVTQ